MMLNELLSHPYLIYVFLGLFSLCIGSLLNVIIYRLPIMLQNEWHQQCCELLSLENTRETEKLNLFVPRSFCPQCKTQIKAWQNIPLFSYLFLRGRCYFCKASVPLRYPFVELLTLVLSLFAAWHWGFTWQLVFGLVALWLLICLFFIDWDTQLLPDSLSLSLLWLGLIANTQQLFTSLPDAVLSTAGAYLSLWLFIQAYYLLTGKVGMGHGDFKLFAAFGAWMGWTLLPLILLMASTVGAICGLIYLKASKKNKDTALPFGPYLCIAGCIALFWGKDIVAWYLH